MPEERRPNTPRLLLVGWDSAEWKVIDPLCDRGRMPLLKRMVASGTRANLRSLEPMLSPMLWTSIATGKQAFDHRVLGFTDVDPLTGKIQPVTAANRNCAAVWDILSNYGYRSHVIGWFATHGERLPNGGVISNLYPAPPPATDKVRSPAPRGTYHPEEIAADLDALRVSPGDIGAETIHLFCPRFAEVDLQLDDRLKHLQVHLAEAFSIQAAACWTLENREWDFLAVYFRAIDEIAHHFMPFHPPRLGGVPEREFELYKEVINGVYRIHDFMLARLVALAGPDTHVILVSDHGFHCDHLRPQFVPRIPAGITVWHRPHGILAASGPSFAQNRSVHGANLLDITPTILHLFGLPTARDMAGKVLLDLFQNPAPVEAVDSYEPSTPRNFDQRVLSDAENRVLLEQFTALGYLDKPTGNLSADAEITKRENTWTLCQSLMASGRNEEALPMLEDLYDAVPERSDFAQALAQCQTALGLTAEANQVLEAIMETAGNQPVAALLRARMAIERKDGKEALDWLEKARTPLRQDTRYWIQLGLALIQTRQWEKGEKACLELLKIDPEEVLGYVGLAICRFQLGRSEEALKDALEATSLNFCEPRAHFILARILLRQGQYDEAETALRTTLHHAPLHMNAHRLLSALYRVLDRWDDSDFHSAAILSLESHEQARKKNLEQFRQDIDRRATKRREAKIAERGSFRQPFGQKGIQGQTLELTVVTGLPRSGTSLLMQMLEAGGYPILTDEKRRPDENNPRGYFEWEKIKKLARDPLILQEADRKAVKIVTPLIPHLPRKHRYRIIFMRRSLLEVAQSQHRMRFGRNGSEKSLRETVVPLLEKHLNQVSESLYAFSDSQVIEVDYSRLLDDPDSCCNRLAEFVGPDSGLVVERMPSVVDPELYRQRQGG